MRWSEHPLPPAGTVLHVRVMCAAIRAINFTLRLGRGYLSEFLDIDRRGVVLRLVVLKAVIVWRPAVVRRPATIVRIHPVKKRVPVVGIS